MVSFRLKTDKEACWDFMSWIRLKGLCRERVLKSNQYLCAEFRIRIQLGQWIRIQEGKNDPL